MLPKRFHNIPSNRPFPVQTRDRFENQRVLILVRIFRLRVYHDELEIHIDDNGAQVHFLFDLGHSWNRVYQVLQENELFYQNFRTQNDLLAFDFADAV